MMNTPSTNSQSIKANMNKRNWLITATGALMVTLAACSTNLRSQTQPSVLTPQEQRLKDKFRGIYGVVTRIDAATQKDWVNITNERGLPIDGSGSLNLKNVKNSSYGGAFPIPRTIRATWRVGSKLSTVSGTNRWQGGTIVGDYTVPVAERIPDEFLDYIRANGGALRLKIRLVDDGILIGWDIEQRVPIKNPSPNGTKNALNYAMPGGDFREAKIYNGQVVERGWYINKSGQRVETDY